MLNSVFVGWLDVRFVTRDAWNPAKRPVSSPATTRRVHAIPRVDGSPAQKAPQPADRGVQVGQRLRIARILDRKTFRSVRMSTREAARLRTQRFA